jgi:hypothetical protein
MKIVLAILLAALLGAMTLAVAGLPSVSVGSAVLALPNWVQAIHATANHPAQESNVHLPAHLEVEPGDGDVGLSTELALPPELRGRELSLTIPYYAGNADLLIDGTRAVRTDDPLVRGYRSAGPLVFRIPEARTLAPVMTLTLVLHVRWTQSAWLDSPPVVSLAGAVPPRAQIVKLVNGVVGALGFAALAQLGLSYSFAYLLQGRRRVQLLFAAQVLAASYYSLYCWGLTQALLGRYEVVVLAITMVAATVSTVYLTHEQFELPPPARAWKLPLVVVVVAAAGWGGPYAATRVPAPIAVLTIALVVVYQVATLVRLVRRAPRPAGALPLLGLWLFLSATISVDALPWLGLGEPLGGVRLACGGLAIFGLGNALLLGRDHTATLDRADELNKTLAGRVLQLEAGTRDIEMLNEELQRQIADRTQQMCAALGLLSSGVQSAPSLAPGTQVCQRYEIVRPLGNGGMGMVFEARRLRDGRTFALKVAHEQTGLSLARVAREAHVASRVAHPNVVRIHDVDVDPAGFLFLLLEYVEGVSLRELRDRFCDASFASEVLRQTALGLVALHAAGIVHRDLKPENILVREEPDRRLAVKLADFGISRVAIAGLTPPTLCKPTWRPPAQVPARDAEANANAEQVTSRVQMRPSNASRDSSLTEHGLLLGTPTYIAPELAAEMASVEPSSDMFSLGVMAFELLSGRRPFEGSAALRIATGENILPPPSLAILRPDLPLALSDALDRCLAFEPSARPTASELAAFWQPPLRAAA